MKKLLLIIILLLSLIVTSPVTFAQGVMGSPSSSIEDAAIQSQRQEEQEGKKFLDGLSRKTITCSQLKDADFEKMGEYFMGQTIGDTSRHIAMNDMMKRMMGERGEAQMHIAWGKRDSGCDTSSQDTGFMQMMGGGGNHMMGYGGLGGFGLGWIFMIIFWVLIILGVVALVRYLGGARSNITNKDKTPLDILKERYAKGEIDKKEFEERKKDLG